MPFLAVLGLLLSGCSGGSDDDPTTLPSLSATPFATASPVPIPPQATANTPQALDAFVRFYFQQLNVAFSISDSSIIRRLSDPACGTCNNYADSLDADRRQVIRGNSFSVSEVAAPPIESTGTVVDVYFSQPSRQLVDLSGRVLQELPAKPQQHFQVNVLRTGDGWRVRGIRRAP